MKGFWQPGKTLRELRVEAVEQALEYFGGNKTHAARDLGVSIRSLRNWIAASPELAHFRGQVSLWQRELEASLPPPAISKIRGKKL